MNVVIILIVYMGAILLLALLPGTDSEFLPFLNPRIQNLLHIPAYTILALLLLVVLKNLGVHDSRGLWIFGLAMGHALLAEILQFWVPGRTASIGDLGADLTGVLLFLVLYRQWQRQYLFYKLR
jgi:VanZ family protein